MPWFRRRSRPSMSEIQIRLLIEDRRLRHRVRRRPAVPTEVREHTRIVVPTDMMFAAWRQLFPAERMAVFGGRRTPSGVTVTSVSDVTEAHPSVAHVRACPKRMTSCLMDLERTGAHLAIWMHSHPGEGLWSTCPSSIDRNQDCELRRDYAERLIGIIAVRDGLLRVWGQAVDRQVVSVQWEGEGVQPTGDPHVFRLQVA